MDNYQAGQEVCFVRGIGGRVIVAVAKVKSDSTPSYTAITLTRVSCNNTGEAYLEGQEVRAREGEIALPIGQYGDTLLNVNLAVTGSVGRMVRKLKELGYTDEGIINEALQALLKQRANAVRQGFIAPCNTMPFGR